ncbi:hypothetical protein HDA40_002148 [Hamadaea flava]|uniref:Uncharacterized protein n=1 Tax=Hamadaea flava TaxID=1742688 RepID=A0ABV8LJP4_9ACTN|nr:hypothetical protein [Hamadaea flava]MCP2323641.1 hypothetical protein [Hamadaea flava]
MRLPDRAELLLCIPAGSSLPLADQIAAHLDGLITGSRFTPIPHLYTNAEHHAVTHGARPLPNRTLACCALPVRYWLPGPMIRALATAATNDYTQWHQQYGHLAPALPARCFLPFTAPQFSRIDEHRGVRRWAEQPLIAAMREQDQQQALHYSGVRLEAITASLATYVDYIVGTHLCPDALITTGRQVIATALDRPQRPVTLREVMAHRDRVCGYLYTLDGDVLLVAVAVGDHNPGIGCTCPM